MKKAPQALLIALAIIGVIIAYVVWNIGLFKPVLVEQVEVPSMQLIFKKYQGPYHEVGKVFEEVEKSLAADNIACDQTFGRYYDSPDEVEAERTRADIGCIVQTKDLSTSETLQAENTTPFKAITGTFEGAPWLTAFKVYKVLRRESYKRNIMTEDKPVWEIYEKIENGYKTKVLFKIKETTL